LAQFFTEWQRSLEATSGVAVALIQLASENMVSALRNPSLLVMYGCSSFLTECLCLQVMMCRVYNRLDTSYGDVSSPTKTKAFCSCASDV